MFGSSLNNCSDLAFSEADFPIYRNNELLQKQPEIILEILVVEFFLRKAVSFCRHKNFLMLLRTAVL